MKVVATAGHVDHGKSTLVSALTGIDPDRLKEEKSREMTIDLGFAWLDMPSGETVGIIDVPGHRDFIENMLAGVGGIDAVIFVIAADEGIMPQTREHLAILELLAIKSGVIALTKSDLIDDNEWLDMVKKDITDAIKSTFLEDCPIIPVSAKTKLGLKDLLFSLEKVLEQVPPREDNKRARLSIDRVFSITGFGTVVTGTLNDGILNVGEEVTILPGGKKGRIRGLQTHKHKLDKVLPGSRTAINIAGLDVSEINRGDLVTTSSFYKSSQRIDAIIKILPISSKTIKHNDEVKVFHLAAERNARVRVLGKDKILPGEEGFVQFEFTDPLVSARNDRFIIRIPSPGETIGGGKILQTDVPRRYKRFSSDVLYSLGKLQAGNDEDRFLDAVQKEIICSVTSIAKELSFSKDKMDYCLGKLLENGELISLSNNDLAKKPQFVITRINWQLMVKKTEDILRDFHTKFPLRSGITREELKSKLKLENKDFSSLYEMLLTNNIIGETGNFVFSPLHTVSFTTQQKEIIKSLHIEIGLSPFSPPGFKTMQDLLGDELLNAMIASQELVRVSTDVIFRKQEYELMKKFVIKKISEEGQLAVTEFRDNFISTRKYALAMLEHLDSIGFTIRDGDYRKMGDFNK